MSDPDDRLELDDYQSVRCPNCRRSHLAEHGQFDYCPYCLHDRQETDE